MVISQKTMSVTRKNVFSKIDSHLIPLLSGRQNHQNIKNFDFLENSDFFDRFESFQDARSVFNFWIFDDFGSPIHQIRNLGVPKFRSQPRQVLPVRFLFSISSSSEGVIKNYAPLKISTGQELSNATTFNKNIQ